MPNNASVKDVAATAGVSLGTVSNVLNHPERVSVVTRARVEQAMRNLGFVRNESARQLRAGRSNTIAFVVLDARNPFFTDVAEGVELAGSTHNLSVYLCNSVNLAEREHGYLDRLVQQRVQGILITPVDPESAQLREIHSRGMPLVLVDRTGSNDDFCSVAVDDVLGGRLAMTHLLDLGHQRIAFVGGPSTLGQVRDRSTGAQSALREAGLKPSAMTTLETDALTLAAGQRIGERLLGIPSRSRPSAVMCANDLIALGLLQHLITHGVRVPEDVAIVGYDDIDFAAAATVPLTSVRQPRRELGRSAADLLIDEATNPEHQHRQLVFTPDLVARSSTLPPQRSPGRTAG